MGWLLLASEELTSAHRCHSSLPIPPFPLLVVELTYTRQMKKSEIPASTELIQPYCETLFMRADPNHHCNLPCAPHHELPCTMTPPTGRLSCFRLAYHGDSSSITSRLRGLQQSGWFARTFPHGAGRPQNHGNLRMRTTCSTLTRPHKHARRVIPPGHGLVSSVEAS